MRSRKQKERTEESVDKNRTIPQDGNTYLQQPEEEETNYSADCASFTEELAELDTEGSRKAKSKAKQARTGNLYQQEVQEQYKEVQLKRNKQLRRSISKKSHKRKMKKYHEQIIVSSSESDDWQPSEEEYISTDESECIKKSVMRKKLSSTMRKQTSDNRKKEGCEEQQSKLTTKKEELTTPKEITFNNNSPQVPSQLSLCLFKIKIPRRMNPKRFINRKNMCHQRKRRRQMK